MEIQLLLTKKLEKQLTKFLFNLTKVKLKNLLTRLKSSNKRPLIKNNISRRKTLENLYNTRRIFYEKADFIVNNDNDKLQALKAIKSELNLYAK